jgi:hypothetical protein
MSYVVTPEGRAIDPIILNSSGGGGFENEARKIVADWEFEPSESEQAWNFVDIRSEIRRGQDRATSNFGRRTNRIMNHLLNDEGEAARKQADETNAMGGWNLYESTMMWLMIGRVEGVEDNHAGKLENYQRALAMGNAKAIPADDRLTLLEKIFLLQSHFNQHAAAARTHERIERMEANEEVLTRTEKRIAEIRAALSGNDIVTAQAVVFNPCDCDAGIPLWVYEPARRTFSFANTGGNVERFEARCEGGRLSGEVSPGQSWSLEPEWGKCRITVFGDDGATFDFLEHRKNDEKGAAANDTVARNHVLDNRSRSQ